jgi:hypothetical protein
MFYLKIESYSFLILLINVIMVNGLHLNKDDHRHRYHSHKDKLKHFIPTTTVVSGFKSTISAFESTKNGPILSSTKQIQDFNQKLNNFNPLVCKC